METTASRRPRVLAITKVLDQISELTGQQSEILAAVLLAVAGTDDSKAIQKTLDAVAASQRSSHDQGANLDLIYQSAWHAAVELWEAGMVAGANWLEEREEFSDAVAYIIAAESLGGSEHRGTLLEAIEFAVGLPRWWEESGSRQLFLDLVENGSSISGACESVIALG